MASLNSVREAAQISLVEITRDLLGTTACPLVAHYPAPTEPPEVALARSGETIKAVVWYAGLRAELRKEVKRRIAAHPHASFWVRRACIKAVETEYRDPLQAARSRLGELGVTPVASLRVLMNGAQGSGKTEAALRAIAEFPERLRRETGLTASIVFWVTAPDLTKALETYEDYLVLVGPTSPAAFVTRGRSAKNPDGSGRPMCAQHKVARDVARSGVSVAKTLCRTCPFAQSCGYLAHQAEINRLGGCRVFFMSRQYNFVECPAPDSDVRVVDEDIALLSVDEPIEIDPDDLPERLLAEADPDALAARKTLKALIQAVVGMGNREANAYSLARVREDVSGDDLLGLRRVLKEQKAAKRKGIAAAFRAQGDRALTVPEIMAILARGDGGLYEGALVLVEAVISEYSKPREALNRVHLDPRRETGRKRRAIRIVVNRLRPIKGMARGGGTLVLDGTGDPELDAKLFPGLQAVEIRIERQTHVTTTRGGERDHGYSTQSLAGEDSRGVPLRPERAAKRRQDIRVIAERSAKPTLVLAPMKVKDRLAKEGIKAETAHFNALRGRNTWKHCRRVISVGALTPPPHKIEEIARAFYGDDDEPIITVEKYETHIRGRRMRDRSVTPVEVQVHPDPRCQRVLEQVREAEVLQGIDRTRPIFHETEIILLNKLCLDITYDENVTHDELVRGTSREGAIFKALGGVLPLGQHLFVAYPQARYEDGFTTSRASERFTQKLLLKYPISKESNSIYYWGTLGRVVRYRLRDQKRPSFAVVDTVTNPDPKTALERVLGTEVVWVEVFAAGTEAELDQGSDEASTDSGYERLYDDVDEVPASPPAQRSEAVQYDDLDWVAPVRYRYDPNDDDPEDWAPPERRGYDTLDKCDDDTDFASCTEVSSKALGLMDENEEGSPGTKGVAAPPHELGVQNDDAPAPFPLSKPAAGRVGVSVSAEEVKILRTSQYAAEFDFAAELPSRSMVYPRPPRDPQRLQPRDLTTIRGVKSREQCGVPAACIDAGLLERLTGRGLVEGRDGADGLPCVYLTELGEIVVRLNQTVRDPWGKAEVEVERRSCKASPPPKPEGTGVNSYGA